ncbi:MAG: lamin tail domain-containing protein [Calditrichota bacterium]
MLKQLLLSLFLLTSLYAQSDGDLIFSEIMSNPSGSETAGEWVEVYNTTGSAIDIEGWQLRSNGGQSHTIANGSALNVPALGFLVLGRSSDALTNGNYTPDYVFGSSIPLNNTTDFVLIERPDGMGGFILIDSVGYDNGSTFPDDNGASMTLTNFTADNSVGSNWISATTRESGFVGATGDTGSPGTLGGDQSLPVSLSAFSASIVEDKVVISWRTESEINNDAFILERGYSAETLRPIAEFQGQGTTNAPTDYSYEDELIDMGQTYFYRLIDRDYSGNVTYHSIVNVTVSEQVAQRFTLLPNFPNPFNPETTLRFEIAVQDGGFEKVELGIYNMLGQKVRDIFQGQLASGSYSYVWDTTDNAGIQQPSGVYLMRLQSGNQQAVRQISLLK